MANYPTSIPSFAGFTSSHTLSQDSHAAQHNLEQGEIVAIANKMGTGASTPVSGLLLRGTGTGTSSWSPVALGTDVTGVLPQANGGTGISSMASGIASFLGTPSSANLIAALLDETGTGMAVFANNPTLIQPGIADFTNSNHTHANVAGGGPLSPLGFPIGASVQVVSNTFSAVATGTTVIPEDDTMPQITEGDEYMTLAITPKSATNRLLIIAKAFVSCSNVNDIIVALFQDTTANGLAAQDVTLSTATGPGNLLVIHDMVAGTTSSTTFRIRIGPAVAGTITFNGIGGLRKFGGLTLSSMTVMEYKA